MMHKNELIELQKKRLKEPAFQKIQEIVKDPVTLGFFAMPVVLNCGNGHVIEQESANTLLASLEQSARRCPCCKEPVSEYQPVLPLKELAEVFVSEFPDLPEIREGQNKLELSQKTTAYSKNNKVQQRNQHAIFFGDTQPSSLIEEEKVAPTIVMNQRLIPDTMHAGHHRLFFQGRLSMVPFPRVVLVKSVRNLEAVLFQVLMLGEQENRTRFLDSLLDARARTQMIAMMSDRTAVAEYRLGNQEFFIVDQPHQQWFVDPSIQNSYSPIILYFGGRDEDFQRVLNHNPHFTVYLLTYENNQVQSMKLNSNVLPADMKSPIISLLSRRVHDELFKCLERLAYIAEYQEQTRTYSTAVS